MADQLEAAGREIVKMRFESFTEATTTLALSNSNQAKDEHIDAITAERDKLQADLEAARREVERMRPVVETSVRVSELDEICDAHPGINDEVGQGAESELYTAVKARTAAVDAYRAARDKGGVEKQ